MNQTYQQADDILIVEDDLDIALLIQQTLQYEGYCVRWAANGEEALRAVCQQQPSLILLDNKMPVLSGVATIRRLRGRGCTLPIVLMTADTTQGQEKLRQETTPFGVTDILSKPFDIDQLLACVERYWNQRAPVARAA